MTGSWRLPVSAAGAIFTRDLVLFCSHRSRIVTTLFTTIVSLSVFYYISRLVHARSVGPPDVYYGYVVVGLFNFGLLTATLAVPVATVRAELQTATFERLVLSPFGAVRAIAALMLFPVALALVLGVVSVGFAAVAFGMTLHWSTVVLAVPVAALAVASFVPFGLAMSAGVVVFKQTNSGSSLVVTALTLLAGVYFPVSLLPGWIGWAADVQPFTPAVDLLRHVLLGMPSHETVAIELAKLVGFAVLATPVTLLVLGAALRRSRRLGTVIEY